MQSETDANSKTWAATYDAHGNVLSATDPLAQKTAYTWGTGQPPEHCADPPGTQLADFSACLENQKSSYTKCRTTKNAGLAGVRRDQSYPRVPASYAGLVVV